MNDGSVRRVPGDLADELVDSHQAKRFVSNTIYRAVKLGIEVKNFGDRDVDGSLRERVKAARKMVTAADRKAEAKRLKKDRDAADHEAAQTVLNDD